MAEVGVKMCPKIRKILASIPEERALEDLQRYRDAALALGATDTKVITTDQIIIDDRVRMKCLNPMCRGYGTNPHCPPYIGDLNQMRKLVGQYKYALFIMLRVPSNELAGPHVREKQTSRSSAMKLDEIVSKIESEAFYDGYHLATGFATGCKSLWCPEEECSAIKPGQSCRYPLKARAGMDAVGMNAYTMAAKVGWEIYPIGEGAKPEDVPHGTRLGIVLIH